MNKTNNKILWKYAGMVMQFFVGIGIAVFIGLQIDKWINSKIPLAAWIFPLLVIIGMIYKIVKDTAPKQ